MAGKKVEDTQGMSKTARASSMKKGGKKEGFIPAAPENMDRIISLAGGEYLYLMDPRDGKTHHLRTGSEKYFATLESVFASDHGIHVRNELARKNFPLPEVAEV